MDASAFPARLKVSFVPDLLPQLCVNSRLRAWTAGPRTVLYAESFPIHSVNVY